MPSKSKTKTSKRTSRINPIDPSGGLDEHDGLPALREDEAKKSQTMGGLYSVAKIATKASKALKGVASAKKAAGRWKNYVTCKRRMETRKDNLKHFDHVDGPKDQGYPANDTSKSSAKNGQGLDDIHEDFTRRKGTRQTTAASNRALIQYFAKLGQSSRSDELLDLDFVEGLLGQGADINCTDTYGQTIFHEVARTWHTDVGKFLIEHGGKISQADNYGRTPLHVAAAVDYADMCEFLIDNGADKEAATRGEEQTPLFYAARNDATKALAVLIQQQCEYKDVRDYRGRTPIYVAAELDRSETARYLLEHHAPVGVVDNSGQPALTWMINKMAPVAKEALNQLHSCDRANRKQYFYLNHLEPIKPGQERDGHAQLPLEVLVQIKNFDLILHPVILEQIRVKWQHYGKFGALRQLCMQIFFIALWTIIALHSPWYFKCQYQLPVDIWKIVIYVVAVGFTVYQIADELREFYSSQKEHRHWKEWRIEQLDQDIEHCHPRWPEEKLFLENEKNDLDKFKSNYFQDFWNIFDWICYAFLLASTITHLVDVFYPSQRIALIHNRIMAINIIMVWLRTMKYVRCFSALGPFIVMLGEMVGDMGKFLFLYFIFLIPFSFAFWMVFGGDHSDITVTNTTSECVVANLKDANSHLLNIAGMVKADETVFSLYRLTLVDEYDLDGMLEKDKAMAYILLGLWFWISAILCLNLFIALLSDTFQRVYDNARANAVMQKAITVLMIEDRLWEKRLRSYRTHIQDKCSPEVVYYDDDTGEDADELKKVTIQTKERVEEIIELWTAKFGHPDVDDQGQRYYDDGESSDDGDDGGEDGGGGGSGGDEGALTAQKSKKSVTNAKLENEVDILRAELTQVEKKRREFEKKCLSELGSLRQLLSSNAIGLSRATSRTNTLPPDYGHIPSNNDFNFDATSPPTYPAAIGERLTPRDDQLRSDASTSHVDISTLPRMAGVAPSTTYTSPNRATSVPAPREAFADVDSLGV